MSLSYDPPNKWTEEMREYLNDLRSSGLVNMFGSAEYLMEEFNLNRDSARQCVLYWMTTFSNE